MLEQEELQVTIARIQQKELYFDEILKVLETKPDYMYEDVTILKMIKELTEYIESGQWLQDYECDERGELPEDFKRGVLSQDALYNLLCDVECKKKVLNKMNALVMNCSPVRNGATAEIVHIVSECLREKYNIKSICIDDYDIQFCKGCRSCHNTAKCVQQDDVDKIIEQYEWADIIVSVAPSYWADIPGQFKVFIDRCTPWCNTHEPHAKITGGKKGYSIALRTGPSMRECDRIIESIEHFYGHMEIECCGRLGLCSVEYKEAVEQRKSEIIEFCNKI